MPPDVTNHSKFCGAALLSGLLTQQQLDEVLRAASQITAGPPLAFDQIDDNQLAKTAVEKGFLNRWQAEHLKAGRNKFTLGPYRILDEIGKGGMSHVFKGEHAMLGRIEAVKVLPKDKTTPDSIARFQREIRAHAQLDHPNLARLSYAGQDGATFFLVTEYVPGTDLRRLVRRYGRLSMQEAATVIAQAAQGLKHAHACGLVHRDIKPGNLLVTPDGRTKVIDLGLAGFLAPEDDGKQRAGKIVGTADYLAPETIRSPGEVSPQSDIYALGCTMYYSVTGKVPFPGGSTAEKLGRHCDPNDVPLNPKRFNPDLDDAFLEVLADMMEKNPAKRIQSAADVITRLAPWTLEAVPTPVQDEHVGSEPPLRAVPIPVTPAGNGPVPHFLDEAPWTDHDGQSHGSQGTDAVASADHETLPLGSPEVIKLGLGVYIYPASMLGPLLLVIALIVTAIVLLAVFLH